MKRSEINEALIAAEATLAEHRWALPEWAGWSVADHRANAAHSTWLRARASSAGT